MTVDSSLPIGAVFGEFKILRPLGEGTFGSVYEAIWKSTKQRVALKVLHRKHLDDRDAVERFFREAEALRQLDHDYVVDVYAFGEQAGVPYIVLEFLDGVALDQRTAQPEALAVGDTLDIMLPVIAAVYAFHQAGIVHRDLKPGNIFLVKDKNRPMIPKVLDFGLAKMEQMASKPGLTLPLVGMGTPNFMSPEQIVDARNVSPLSDQFSIGVILYFLLTGQKPFDAPAQMHTIKRVLDGSYTSPRELAPSIPPELEAVIVRAMSHKDADRFSSLWDMGQALLPFAHPGTRALMAHDFATPVEAEPLRPTPSNVPVPTSVLQKHVELGRFSTMLDERKKRDEDDRRSFRSTLVVWAVVLAVSTGFITALGSTPNQAPSRRTESALLGVPSVPPGRHDPVLAPPIEPLRATTAPAPPTTPSIPVVAPVVPATEERMQVPDLLPTASPTSEHGAGHSTARARDRRGVADGANPIHRQVGAPPRQNGPAPGRVRRRVPSQTDVRGMPIF